MRGADCSYSAVSQLLGNIFEILSRYATPEEAHRMVTPCLNHALHAMKALFWHWSKGGGAKRYAVDRWGKCSASSSPRCWAIQTSTST